MKLKDLMTRNVEVVQQTASLQDAARKMKDLNVGSLPVVDDQKQVLGMVTDRDIVIRSVAEGHDPQKTPIQAAMSKEFIYGFEEMDIKEAAKLMRENQIRRLPVVDHQNHLVGIVSLGDISVDAKSDKMSAQVLEDISQPAKPDR